MFKHLLVLVTLLTIFLNPSTKSHASGDVFQCLMRQLVQDSPKIRRAMTIDRADYLTEQLSKKYYDVSQAPKLELKGPLSLTTNSPIELKDAQGVLMGSIIYKRYADMLFDATVWVDPAYRGQELSTLLIAAMLIQNPKAKRIEFLLVGTNHAEFNKAYLQTGDVKTAFMQTPGYKSFSKLGITTFDDAKTKAFPGSTNGEVDAYISMLLRED